MHFRTKPAALAAATALLACAGAHAGSDDWEAPVTNATTNAASAAATAASPATAVKVVFVIAMENHDAGEIYGNKTDAPYINNTLIPAYAHTTSFVDELPTSIPSEPHYVWMDAGTNAFSDHTFTGDGDPTSSNSTSSTAHLATQITNAGNGTSWMSYQEGIVKKKTGLCPITSSGNYAAKHDPFVFFRDVAGSPPSKTNTYCSSHHKDYSALAADLAAGTVATYNFITPNLCHDMHGGSGCASNTIKAGDQWLQSNLPAIISYANAHNGVIYLTWDEGENTTQIPFLAIGPHVKAGYAGGVKYTHSSMLKSVEESLALAVLPTVSSANDLSDLFVSGFFP